jgi:hypothetical protein
MPNESTEFRQRLLDAEQTTPALRDAYQKELHAMLHHTLTPRARLPLVGLLLVLAALTGGIAYRMLVSYPGPLVYGAWATELVLCASFALWITRVLWQGTTAWTAYFRMGDVIGVAAGLITVLALFDGLRDPHDPASTYNVLFVLVLFVQCLAWSLLNRIASAELAGKEQMLRIECRLAELADRLQK